MDNFITFNIPLEAEGESDDTRFPLTTILNNIIQRTPTPLTQPSITPSIFKYDRELDPSLYNIKEFADNFKEIKAKLKAIQDVIDNLEKQRDMIRLAYEDVYKKLTGFFAISDTSDLLRTLQSKAAEMITRLDLDKYYEEKNKMLAYYKAAVPLLEQVKQEFFGEAIPTANCPICYEKNVTHMMYPCGHTLCDSCKKKVTNSCFVCRASVNTIAKIYLA